MTAIAMRPDPDLGDRELGVTEPRVVNSEWIKFRTLRSTWWSIGVALLIAIGLGLLFAYLQGRDMARNGGFEPDQTALTLRGFYLAQLAIGILGVLFITGEYSTGMIRATLSAVPKRIPMWAAKIIVFTVVIFVITLIASFIAFLVGQAILSGYTSHGTFITGPKGGIAFVNGPGMNGTFRFGVPLSHPGSLRAIFGAALYMVGVGLLGLGLGFMIRNTGAAIGALFGLLLVLPLLSQALPHSIQIHITKFLPLLAGTAGMQTVHDNTDQLGAWAGLGVFAIYVVVALGAGLFVLKRRDA
jgi:ABC-type transport system involved in multi-copper enzyme maturation permease subunit